MLLPIPDVLTPDQVAHAQRVLAEAEWQDGRATAGHQSARTKALGQNGLFISAALPKRVFTPFFNRYMGGQPFGTHVDNAIRQISGTGQRIRTDLSATLFLADPAEYEGGDLAVEDTCGP
jgi:PKHD-type hydroxylase